MVKTFLIAYRLKNAYRVNGIIYGFKQVPIIKKFLPTSLYNNQFLKGLATCLSTVWEIISFFLGKACYFSVMIIAPLLLIKYSTASFLQLLLCLSLGGALFNTGICAPSKDKYYAIILMKMDGRELILSQYLYTLIKHYLGNLVSLIVLSNYFHFPSWSCYIIPLGIIGLKLLVVVYYLNIFKKRRIVHSETDNSKLTIFSSIGCLVIAYLSVMMQFVMPINVILTIYVAASIMAIGCLVYVLRYPDYHQFSHKLLANGSVFIADNQQALVKDTYHQMITLDTNISSNKKGFEYFNELFMQRHKKIMWKSAKRLTYISGMIVIVALVGLLYVPEIQKDVFSTLKISLPYMAFVLYMINPAKKITQAMFINCDHCMLSYSFYRIPKNILELFKIRLKEIIKINLLPTIIIAFGYGAGLLICGGNTQMFFALISFVSIISMSIFFSTHYLILYYLLQPYNAETEIKNPVYSTVVSLTYLVCYGLIQLRLPIFEFGLACISFCLSYVLIACILVYKKAGNTFKIRK